MASSRHDADKENALRTRVPLPKGSLPALTKHNKLHHKPGIPHRRPLKTLNVQSTNIPKAGTSKTVAHKPKHDLNETYTKDDKMRQRSEDLDWHYTVFNDRSPAEKNASDRSISDDESYLDNRGGQLGAVLSAVTPNVKIYLELSPVRKNKKSLKRSHSREPQLLQEGLSPPVSKQEKPDDKVKCQLKLNENIQDRLKTPEHRIRLFKLISNREYTGYLQAKEMKLLNMPKTSNVSRACVINWLMKINGADGNPAIIQTACWYLDSILGIVHIQLYKLHVVAAACFWIAQKVNGHNIPAARLVRYSKSAFTADKLLVTERAILKKLKFTNQPIVAQDYITHLSSWCDTENAGEIEVAATFLVMCGLMVNRVLCDEYPSVIAVAAVRNALLLLRRNDLMMLRLQMCNIFKVAVKKATNFSYTCSFLCRAARTVAAPFYEYKVPLEHYGTSPSHIAQRMICAANDINYTNIGGR